MRALARVVAFLACAAAIGACTPGARTAEPAASPPAAPRPAEVGRPARPAVVLGFARAKTLAAREVYRDHRTEVYCGCTFTPGGGAEGGALEPRACGYVPRNTNARARRMEWEHVVPAKRLGGELACWSGATEGCLADGKRGRACCSRSEARGGDPRFHAMEGDLHNLMPAAGELNGDRSDRPHGEVEGEPRAYGACDFEIDRASGRAGVTEPPDGVRGDVARVWLYVVDVWGVVLTPEEAATFRGWSDEDPIDAWERERDARIEKAQGNRNHHLAR